MVGRENERRGLGLFWVPLKWNQLFSANIVLTNCGVRFFKEKNLCVNFSMPPCAFCSLLTIHAATHPPPSHHIFPDFPFFFFSWELSCLLPHPPTRKNGFMMIFPGKDRREGGGGKKGTLPPPPEEEMSQHPSLQEPFFSSRFLLFFLPSPLRSAAANRIFVSPAAAAAGEGED